MTYLREILSTQKNNTVHEVSMVDTLLDGQGMLKTVSQTVVFNSKLTYDKRIDQWTETSYANPNIDINTASSWIKPYVNLSLPSGEQGKITRQTREWFNHTPGAQQRVLISFSYESLQNGSLCRIGMFESQSTNGIVQGFGLELKGSDAFIFHKTNPTASYVKIPISQWINKFNFGAFLTSNTCITLVIDINWLGTTNIKFGFLHKNEVIPIYELNNSMSSTDNIGSSVPFIEQINLPIVYEIESDGTSTNASVLKCFTATVITECKGFNSGKPIVLNRIANSTGLVGGRNVFTAGLGVRLDINKKGAKVILKKLESISISNANLNVQAILNPTFTNNNDLGSWASYPNSSIQYNASLRRNVNSSTLSGIVNVEGRVIESNNITNRGYDKDEDIDNNTLSLGFYFNDNGVLVPDELYICALEYGLNRDETFYPGITLLEL